jgi:hypothetical protein
MSILVKNNIKNNQASIKGLQKSMCKLLHVQFTIKIFIVFNFAFRVI